MKLKEELKTSLGQQIWEWHWCDGGRYKRREIIGLFFFRWSRFRIL